MTRRGFAVAALAVLLSTLPACTPPGTSNETRETMGGGKIYPTYRYRLTVEVDSPEGLKSGSSVIEVKTRIAGKYSIPSPGAVSHQVRGEAVAVDLGKSGTLFALLRSDVDSDWASRVLFLLARTVSFEEVKDPDENASFDLRFKDMMTLRGPQTLPRHFRDLLPRDKSTSFPTAYPMLVRFGDIADPKTVAKVDPDALAASFGKGVKLRRITVERTEDAVTTGIEGRFKWWESFRNRQLDGERLNNSQALPNNLNRLSFKSGESL